MADVFKIDKIERFYEAFEQMEISDISKIIRSMISIKNDSSRKTQKKTKPYDITDKLRINEFSDNIKVKITKHHIDSYDIVDDAITCLEEYEASIRNDLYDYYWEAYTSTLIKLDVSISNESSIKSRADEIYSSMLDMIYSEIFDGKTCNIETNKRITYLSAISAYVFYRCKFLIPIENECEHVV